MIFCGLRPELLSALNCFGLTDLIGRDNLFETRDGVFGSAKAALNRARQLLGRSIDMHGLDLANDNASWAYSI